MALVKNKDVLGEKTCRCTLTIYCRTIGRKSFLGDVFQIIYNPGIVACDKTVLFQQPVNSIACIHSTNQYLQSMSYLHTQDF